MTFGSFFEWNGIRTFDREMESKSSLSEIIVLNTCIFNIVEYNPTDIIAELTELEYER